MSYDHFAEQNHWSERGRATPVANADALGRPRRSVLSLGVITPHTNMKPQTNTSKLERLAKWQAVHKQLQCDDAQYRKRFHSYLATLICLSCILLLFYLPFFGIRLFGFAVDVSIITFVAAMIVFLSLRQLLFQNRRVQSYLQTHHDT